MPISFQQALCATKSLIQCQNDFVLNIPSTSRARLRNPATASTTPARLAKDTGEEVGIRRCASEKVFQVFGTDVLDARTLARLDRPILPVEILLAAARPLPLLILHPQLIILLTLFLI